MTEVHAVLPGGIDDPARPSGGNIYDRRVLNGLRSIGWTVHEHAAPGSWPRPDATSLAALAGIVERLPGDAVVLLDGLVASTAPALLVPHAGRLRLVVLVHMSLGHREPADRSRERAVLEAAAAVVTTSAWTGRRLHDLYALPMTKLHVAHPGVDAADLAAGTADGRALLCVAAVTFDKGHDLLLDALHTISTLSWQCVCVGSLDREPAFVDDLRRHSASDRVSFPGPLTGADLDRSYAAADVVILPSRAETYGMVVTEALARGLPVIAADVGGVTEALGHAAGGIRPGLLVRPDDPPELAAALRAWLGDPALRVRLRRAARERRASLSRWSATTSVLAGVLSEASR